MHALWIRLFGPVFARELLEISRQRRTYFLRVLYGLVLLYAAYQSWNIVGSQTGLGLTQMAQLSGRLFNTISVLQLLAIYLVVPVLLCNSIAGERNAGTLDLLFTTHLTDREIILGKVAGRVVAVFTLVLSSIPIIALFALFGGVSFQGLVAMEVYSVGALVLSGGTAIAMSTRSQSPIRALGLSYFALAILSAVLVLVATVLERVTFSIRILVSPWTGEIISTLQRGGIFYVFAFGLLQVFVAFMMIRWAIRSLHVIPKKKKKPWKPMFRNLKEIEEKRRLAAAEGSLWGPLEIRAVAEEPSLTQNWWVFGVVGGSFAINTYALREYESGGLFGLFLPMWIMVFLFSGLIAISNPILVRRPGFFDLLLGTLLTPRDVLVGAVSVNKPWLLRIYLVPWLFAMLWMSGNPMGLVLLTVVGTGFGGLILMLGNICSLADPRAIHRIWPTFLVPAGMIFLPSLLPIQWQVPQTYQLILLALLLALTIGILSRGELSPFKVAFHAAAVFGFLAILLVFLPIKVFAIGPGAVVVQEAWEDAAVNSWQMMSPWFWLVTLAREESFAGTSSWLIVVAYSTALWLTIADLWYWALRHFDRLVGRGILPKQPPSPILKLAENGLLEGVTADFRVS